MIISLNSLVFVIGSSCVFHEKGINQISPTVQSVKNIHDVNVDYIKVINFPCTILRLASHFPAERSKNLKTYGI